jgi:tRNA dimethylallyltransferase
MYYHYGMLAAVLCGATATGKSALALRLAEANGFEILSADSRQMYKGLEVGTGAPTAAEKARVPHHLVGVLDPARAFSPREYPSHAHRILDARPEARFLLVGGTGLYLKELLFPSPFDRGPTPEPIRQQVQERIRAEGLPRMHAELLRLDPEGAAGIHPNDAYRIAKRCENLLLTGESYTRLTGPLTPDPRFAGAPVLWLDTDREALYVRIDARVEAMVQNGWLDETRRLMQDPAWRTLPAFSSLGYAAMTDVAEGKLDLKTAVASIQKQTRNYAKRQRTFFRHQIPGAIRWDIDALRQALDRCEWSWEAFLESGQIPENKPDSTL